MKNRLCYSPVRLPRVISRIAALSFGSIVLFLGCLPAAWAGGEAPQWMHAASAGSMPSYDEKTNAVLLYSETDVTVLSADKIKTHVREAYKILRPGGRERGTVAVYLNPQRRLKSLHAW